MAQARQLARLSGCFICPPRVDFCNSRRGFHRLTLWRRHTMVRALSALNLSAHFCPSLLGSPSHLFNRSPVMGNPAIVPAPRGMNVIAAARYMGVSPGTFRKLVRLGIMPQPLNIPEIERNVFDRQAIDDAMSARAASHGVS
jgi:hypothetical protein